jgi:uncharacterized protein (TIGR02270 family)
VTDAAGASPKRIVFKGPPLDDVLLEHLEELAFLAIQRRKLLFAHDVPLFDFKPHDERIAAHWDGLVVGGEAAVELSRTRLRESDPWDVFAAARVWIDLGRPDPEAVFEAIDEAKEEAPLGWRAALRECDASTLSELAEPAMASSSTAVEAAFTYALGWHGLLPGSRTPALAASPDTAVRRSLARALGWGGLETGTAQRIAASLVTDPDPEVRAAALWSVALMSPDGAGKWCRDRAADGGCDPFHVRLLGLLGGPQDLELIQAFAESDHELRVAGIFALGDLGNAGALSALRSWLGSPDPDLAAAALRCIRVVLDEVPPGASEEGAETPESGDGSEDQESEEEWWARMTERCESANRMLRGFDFPWSGDPARQPMAFLWRSILHEPGGEPAWLRREVPDGWFSGLPLDEAVPGE